MRSHGMSLIEVLIAITLTGVIAMLTLPKFLISQESINRNTANKTEQLMQALAVTMETYQDQTGLDLDPATVPYENVILNYGNYFAFKETNVGGPEYFMLSDGSRLTTDPGLFNSPLTLPDYQPAVLLNTNWKDPAGGPGYCSIYPAIECLYLDINGRKPPNTIGRYGDIIPIRIDPATGEVKTLYQWAVIQDIWTPLQRCPFLSSYDLLTDVFGAAACP